MLDGTNRRPRLTSLNTPIRVLSQAVPQPGCQVRRGRSAGLPVMVRPDIPLDLDLTPDELGSYLWLAARQDAQQVTATRDLAAWWASSGSVADSEALVLAWDAVRRMEDMGLLVAEPEQEARLAALEQEEGSAFTLRSISPPPSPPARTPGKTTTAEADTDLHEPNSDGDWTGPWPLSPATSYPERGRNVVYVLRAENDLVVYVGSTNHFRARMKAHRSAGKRWTSWLAHPCGTREEAFEVESEFLRIYMPHLNVAGPPRS